MPKNTVFYELFEKVANNVKIMGTTLKEEVAEPDFDKRAALITKLEDLEHANDELTHNIFTELGRNFITPFDREDIHYLATSLDDIADYIYACLLYTSCPLLIYCSKKPVGRNPCIAPPTAIPITI